MTMAPHRSRFDSVESKSGAGGRCWAPRNWNGCSSGTGVLMHLSLVGRRTCLTFLVLAGLGGSAFAQGVPGAPPARIVSTSPSITESLFALGLGDRVVGVSTYCRYPAEVAKLPRVGTFLKPQAEIISRLNPDLVFVHTGPNSAASQLASLGIRTSIVDRGGLSSIYATIRQIGSAAHVDDRAERLVADISGTLTRVKAAVAGRPARKILIIVGRRTGTLSDIIAVGPGSYLHELATVAGGTNILADSKLEYPRISMETVIAMAPDVIVDVGEMGETPASSAERRATTERLWSTQSLVKAVRDGNVHAITDEAFVVPGPRVLEVARTLALWLHGMRVQ
jgi:iron complex transport system substrate-binding protein